jgi:PKD repeat protein
MSPSVIVGPNPLWWWDWGDGTSTNGGIVASHIYATPRVYPVTLTIDDGGIVRSAVVGVVTIHTANGLSSTAQTTLTVIPR